MPPKPQQPPPAGQGAPTKGVPPDPAKLKPGTLPPGVQPPKTPLTPRKITCLFKLPSSADVNQKNDDNQGNTLWRWITGLDAIKGLAVLSARLQGLYMVHVTDARKLNGKWRFRITDIKTTTRAEIALCLHDKAVSCKSATMVMENMDDDFWTRPVDLATHPEEGAIGFVAGANAATRASDSAAYAAALRCISKSVQEFHSTTDRKFRQITICDGIQREETAEYVQGNSLVPSGITVVIRSENLVDAMKILYDIYDKMTDEKRSMQIRTWSEECMRQVGYNCNLTKIPFHHFYDLLLRVQELDGNEPDLGPIKSLTVALLSRGRDPLIIAVKEALELPDSIFKDCILRLDKASREEKRAADYLAASLSRSARHAQVSRGVYLIKPAPRANEDCTYDMDHDDATFEHEAAIGDHDNESYDGAWGVDPLESM